MTSVGRCVVESGHFQNGQMGCKIKDSCTGQYLTGWFECYQTTQKLWELQQAGKCTDCSSPAPPAPSPSGSPCPPGYTYDSAKNYCWATGQPGYIPTADDLKYGFGNHAPTQPPATACQEGTTRTVKCPKNGRDVLQKCINGTWVTQPGEEEKCQDEDQTNQIIAAVILVIVIFFLWGKK